MFYKYTIPTDKNGYLTECPVCKNTEFSDNAKYCRVCGLNRLNICTESEDYGKPHVNPSNARYCEICGAVTTFFHLNLLLPWNDVPDDMKSDTPENTFDEDNSDVPEGSLDDNDNELPF